MISSIEMIDVVVIGGGQAGLATSHELARAGVEHVVLERDRIGSSWAGLRGSFQRNTPNWGLRLPGMSYDGDRPDDFMSLAAIVAYLERYAAAGGYRGTNGCGGHLSRGRRAGLAARDVIRPDSGAGGRGLHRGLPAGLP